MPSPVIAVAIPTLHGGPLLRACLESLAQQTERNFVTVVVDNSGTGHVAAELASAHFPFPLEVQVSPRNLGFAEAINTAFRLTRPRYLATLNDDAEADSAWLSELCTTMQADPEIGMCASQVVLYGSALLDSAGMLLYPDGVARQRGHRRPPAEFEKTCDALFPSASAALYRAAMLDQIGLFDASFFLYCEDTDLGLRARRAGWGCRYVATARVRHHYSQSSGAASVFKARYVERNRLRVAVRNFPSGRLAALPLYSAIRYGWHLYYALRGVSAASELARGAGPLAIVSVIASAHFALLRDLPALLVQRRAIAAQSRLTPSEFNRLLHRYALPAREVARW